MKILCQTREYSFDSLIDLTYSSLILTQFSRVNLLHFCTLLQFNYQNEEMADLNDDKENKSFLKKLTLVDRNLFEVCIMLRIKVIECQLECISYTTTT
jgi:hypothetical protein